MDNFREFITSSPCQKADQPVGKWDVVLFTGNYNPITVDEHDRIRQFVDNVIRNDTYQHLFAPTVELGLVFDDEDDNLAMTESEMVLNNVEKDFITTKFFGLRGFPVSYRRLKWLTIPVPDKDKLKMNAQFKIDEMRDDMLTMFYPALENIKRSFDKVNVLIVVNPSEPNAIPELDHIVTNFEDDTIKIGFMSWRHLSKDKIKELGNVPVNGDMLKAVVLMDHDRPEPEDLKAFAYKYGLKHLIEDIRSVHFRVDGEYYLRAFMTLFPKLIVYEDDETNIEDNYRVVLEILKKMYFKDNYFNQYQIPDSEEVVDIPADEADGGEGEEEIEF